MPTVTREVELPVDPEEAWADVAEAARLGEWMDEGRRIRFVTGDSEITFTVTPLETGTRVRVTETAPVLRAGPRLQALALCPA